MVRLLHDPSYSVTKILCINYLHLGSELHFLQIPMPVFSSLSSSSKQNFPGFFTHLGDLLEQQVVKTVGK